MDIRIEISVFIRRILIALRLSKKKKKDDSYFYMHMQGKDRKWR